MKNTTYLTPTLYGFLLVSSLLTPAFARDTPKAGAKFSASSIKAQITYLASDELRGRGSGEAGNEKAAKFIATEFAKYGLKPLGTRQQRILEAPLDGSGFFQPFKVRAGRVVGKGNLLEVAFGGQKRTYRANQEYAPSGVSGSGKAEGELVFVGYGVRATQASHDDYQGVEVKNKIVLLMAGTPGNDPHGPLADFGDIRRKARDARDAGAAAVLVVLPKDSDVPANANSFEDTSDAGLPVLRVRAPLVEEWLKSAGKDLTELQKTADTRKIVSMPLNAKVRVAADVKVVERITANIVGLLEGSDPTLKEDYIVIGAHMDHLGMGGAGSLDKSGHPAIHHGADDNASGTAGVLQLANYFASNGGAARPKRSLIFICFSGEEMGLLGSAHYCANPILPLARTVAMLNMDMIGRLKNNSLVISGSGTAKEWNPLLDELNRTANFTIARSDSGFGASDQQSFYVKDVPVLFFFTGLHEDYHTPTDTADKINAEGEARVLELVTACAESIANNSLRPTFQKMKQPDTPTASRGFRVYFGSIPNYAATVEGVQLDGVRAGSPADKGGLKAGDVIVKFGDKTIKNVQDYTLALGDYKPGDKLSVVIVRGDKTLTLTVTLAARKE